jgi:hypothetical protein
MAPARSSSALPSSEDRSDKEDCLTRCYEHKVGIWIDHKKAVTVSASGDPQIVAKVKEHYGIDR